MTHPYSRTLRAALVFMVAFALTVLGSDVLLMSQAPQGRGAGGRQGGAEPSGPPVTLKGTLQRVKVHGKSLEGNLLRETPAPEVSIYLPPSYAAEKTRRYPVVYLLHGYTGTDLSYFNNNGGPRFLPAIAERVFAAGGAREMILVMPNAMTVFGGSMYSNSVAVGDWESYVADDLVAYMDKHYRTIPARDARGLGGHSMGGYGTIRIAMKRPDVFAAIYALSSCCLNEISVRGGRAGQPSAVESIKTLEEARGNRGAQNTLVRAAAWSPNPANPPLFVDLPTKDGEVVPAIAAKWAANSPMAMLDQYVPNLKTFKAIALDIGLQDTLISGNRLLVEAMTRYGIAHTFETYEGDHGNRIPQRMEEKVLPYFSAKLSFQQPGR
jgi:S-formylglutathione hydrolase FrmB